ncbi:cadherin repeat domain-containing protein, partial [Pseudoalteromonas fuliginea]|uniref:cadherin repeat domain-containing protein n=1 Tax=Pseudoalteromonas fuliginea TaxID=1872678 RepID=UPI0005FA6E7A
TPGSGDTDNAISPVVDTDGDADKAANNTISENVTNGATVGITANATDADTGDVVSYGLTDDSIFTIDSTTGVVTVKDASSIDYETATSHSITVVATSTDGSTSTQTFTINVTDADGS